MLAEFWNHKGWAALVPLALAAVAFYAWIAIGADARAMNREGIETEATIVDMRRSARPAATNTGSGTVGRVSFNYYVTAMFSTGEALDGTLSIRQVEHFVDRAYFDATSVGDRVWLRYLPDNPDRIELVRGGTQSNGAAAGWVALGMLVCTALIGGLIWTQAAKVHRFKSEGTPVEGTVTEASTASGWTVLGIRLPDGREVKALPIRNRTVAPGNTLTVLVDPHQPGQVLIPPTD